MRPNSQQPSRPSLALRVGITGARGLRNDRVARLHEQLHTVLANVGEEMERLAGEQAVAAAYAHDEGRPLVPKLRFLSPLARGADRLAAEAALARGYELFVPMPFPQAEYEKDFRGAEKPDEPPLSADQDLAQFRALLARAGDAWLALDGDHSPEIMNRAYEAVGRFVVRHCDLLIAIWDWGSGGGRGGTAEIVRYAAHTGVPVWWIHDSEDRAPVWIADIEDLRDPQVASKPAETQLSQHIIGLISPAVQGNRHRHGIVERLARFGRRRHVSPETRYFAGRHDTRPCYWRAYSQLMLWTSGLNPPGAAERCNPDDPIARYWFDRYEPADARAGGDAARYRSSYVWVFLLGTLAVIFGTVALMLSLLRPQAAWVQKSVDVLTATFGVAELTALGFILALVVLAIRQDWHEHSIEFRLLAELYRKQQVLAPLGWTLPIAAVRRLSASDDATKNRIAWIAWLFAAEERAAPFPHGELAQAARGAPRNAVLEELIAEQHDYHSIRWKMAEAAAHMLERWGELLFIAVCFCVVFKLVLADVFDLSGAAVPFGFFAAVLPAVSAAVVGIRAYAELPILAEQSRYMLAELERARSRVHRLDTGRKLVSQDLGAEAAEVATLMLQDLEGWARLFRVKGLEPS